jgi:hypothetical protein
MYRIVTGVMYRIVTLLLPLYCPACNENPKQPGCERRNSVSSTAAEDGLCRLDTPDDMNCVGLTHQMTALTLGNSACYRLRQLSTVQQPVQDRASSLEAPAGCGISNCVYAWTAKHL